MPFFPRLISQPPRAQHRKQFEMFPCRRFHSSASGKTSPNSRRLRKAGATFKFYRFKWIKWRTPPLAPTFVPSPQCGTELEPELGRANMPKQNLQCKLFFIQMWLCINMRKSRWNGAAREPFACADFLYWCAWTRFILVVQYFHVDHFSGCNKFVIVSNWIFYNLRFVDGKLQI